MSGNANRYKQQSRDNRRAIQRMNRQQTKQAARTHLNIQQIEEKIVRALRSAPNHFIREDSRAVLHVTLARRGGIKLRTQEADHTKGRQLRMQGDHYREFIAALNSLIDTGRITFTVEDKLNPEGPCAVTLVLTRDEVIEQMSQEAYSLPLPDALPGVIMDGDYVEQLTSHQARLLDSH